MKKSKVETKAPAAKTKDNGLMYVLTLYVTATTPRSTKAIANIRKLCDQYLNGRYDLDGMGRSAARVRDSGGMPGEVQPEREPDRAG